MSFWGILTGGAITKRFGDITNNIGNSTSGNLAMIVRDAELFGSRNRTMVLVGIRLLEETYPSELAALLGIQIFSVQSILASLEQEGAVTSRLMGRTRLVSLNRRYFAFKELSAILWALGKQDIDLQQKLGRKRRRPRRIGKPVVA